MSDKKIIVNDTTIENDDTKVPQNIVIKENLKDHEINEFHGFSSKYCYFNKWSFEIKYIVYLVSNLTNVNQLITSSSSIDKDELNRIIQFQKGLRKDTITDKYLNESLAKLDFLTFDWNIIGKVTFYTIFNTLSIERLAWMGGLCKIFPSDLTKKNIIDNLWHYYQK